MGLYWLWMARGVKPAERRESLASRAAHVLPLVLVGWLLAAPQFPIVRCCDTSSRPAC
jgi:hypothetical protein